MAYEIKMKFECVGGGGVVCVVVGGGVVGGGGHLSHKMKVASCQNSFLWQSNWSHLSREHA